MSEIRRFALESGYSLEDIPHDQLCWFLEYTTLIVLNRHHSTLSMTTHEYQERIRKVLRHPGESKWNDFIFELADEMLLKVLHELPKRFSVEHHFFGVTRHGNNVHVKILVSMEAIDLGIFDLRSISDLVY